MTSPTYSWIIGTDEAGYGPNLGPLVVSATLWRVEHSSTESFSAGDVVGYLNKQLESLTVRQSFFPLIDSKKLYHSGDSIDRLEQVVQLAAQLAPLAINDQFPDPFDVADNIACEKTVINSDDIQRINDIFSKERITLVSMRSRTVHPQEYNQSVQTGLKSDLLADVTLGLVHVLIEECHRLSQQDRSTVAVLCDKFGGRNRYLPLLLDQFDESLITVLQESREESRYRFHRDNLSIEIRFQMKGEKNIPTALASIISKYRREKSMELFNAFWKKQLPALRPTAGYPVDALRFIRDVAPLMESLSIDKDLIWRIK